MLVYELSVSGFESCCSHSNFRYRACFEQGVPWHTGNYRVWVHSETHIRDMIRTYSQVHRTEHKYSQHSSILAILASLAEWLSVRLETKWLWVQIPLLSLKLQILRLFRARSSLTCRQTIECRFTMKRVRGMIITYSQIRL